jgi:hypothetical protein
MSHQSPHFFNTKSRQNWGKGVNYQWIVLKLGARERIAHPDMISRGSQLPELRATNMDAKIDGITPGIHLTGQHLTAGP